MRAVIKFLYCAMHTDGLAEYCSKDLSHSKELQSILTLW